ncbi:MAG: class I SAM-dependent methyltransferase [Candidatus Micrarchaeia archaeon]
MGEVNEDKDNYDFNAFASGPFGYYHFHGYGGRHRSIYNMKEIVFFLDINKSMDVIDLGTGDGYFSKEFAKYAKSVTAVDINDEYFAEMEKEGIKTIKEDLCKFSNGLYDLAFMSNVYHGLRMSCKDAFLKNLGGITNNFAIMDFNEKMDFGPRIRVSKDTVIKDLSEYGFELAKQKDFEYHYLLVFSKRV